MTIATKENTTMASPPSGPDAVPEIDRAVAEAAFVQELQVGANAVGEHALSASHDDGHEEEVDLVDEARLDRLPRERGTADGDVGPR